MQLLRGSETRTYRRCRWKWHWHYGKLLEPKRKKGALTFGTLVHKAMEVYYPPGRKRGDHPSTTFERLYVENIEQFDQWDDEGNRVDALELGIAMLQGYVKRWGDDDYIEILQPEQTYQIDVYDKNGNYLVTLVGTFDALAVSHKTGRKFIFEHKTAKSIEDVRINSNYGDQGMGYCWAANIHLRYEGLLAEDEAVDGIMYNFLRKALPDTRPQDEQGRYLNKPTKAEKAVFGPDFKGKVSKKQPAPLFQRQELILGPAELRTYETRIRRQAEEMARVRKRQLPIYKNPTRDCAWDCPFVNACELHEMGGDYRSLIDMEFKKWDPYSAHELEMELKR